METETKSKSYVVSGTKFNFSDNRYQLIKPIGHGAYGVVVSAHDSKSNEKVAIKKVSNAFEDLIDAKRILREIKLLRHFNHENIISITDILRPKSLDTFEDVYIVTDLMETDLHRIIYSRQQLTDEHCQYFVHQMLKALKYIHSAGVIHRDLKPSNLLLNSNCDLKICDFGLARGLNVEDPNNLTEYVVTRWYRAPEIMLSCKEYTYAIDVWSVGCILAELLQKKPLFPGDDYIHQLRIIADILGSPAEDELNFVTSEKAKRFMKTQPFKPRVPFAQLFPKANPAAVDLLEKMLVFNPHKRISVDDALAHEYMSSLDASDDDSMQMDNVCDRRFIFENEDDELSKPMLQEMIWMEMCKFHPEAMVEIERRRKQGNMAIDTLISHKK